MKKIKSRYQPFIKWVGGKRGLLEQILPYFPEEFNNYHEPFLGGGAVFFELYSKGLLKDKKIYLSDINSELINAYKIVKERPKELIEELKKCEKKHCKEFYYEVREKDRLEDFPAKTVLERAVRFIYLNKTCFNGLYRVNKKGYFNTPMGSYKNPNIVNSEVILQASEALKNVTLLNQSFEKVIENVEKNDLIYFDPPYYPLSKTSKFTSYDSNSFLENEQQNLYEIFKKLDELGCFVIHSNSETEYIKNLYETFNINIVNANRFINSKSSGRGKITEVLITNK